MTTYPPTYSSTRQPSPWQPVWEIVRFELQDSFHTPFPLIAFTAFFLLGLVTIHVTGMDLPFFEVIRKGFGMEATKPGDWVPFANAPLMIMRVFIHAILIVIILTIGIFTDRATKDFANGVDGLLFTTPLKEWQFGLGRLIASFLISFFISLGLGLGLLVAQSLPWMDSARIAPFNLLAYIQPYLYLVIPNILIFGLISFALGLLTHRSLAGYLGFAAILLLQLVVEALLSLLNADPFLHSLISPSGTSQIEATAQFWTKVEQNTLNVPFAPVIWLSRLLYLALSVALFVWVWRRFSFSGSISRPNSRLEKLLDWAEQRLMFWKARVPKGDAARTLPAPAAVVSIAGSVQAPPAHLRDGFGAQLYDVWRIAVLELKRLIWNPLILTILIISLIGMGSLIVPLATGNTSPLLPVTEVVVTGLDFLLKFIAPLVIVFLAGDLVWREREVKVDPLSDALPVRSWAFVWGKLLAMGVLLLLTLVLLTIGGLLGQTVNRYTNYQLGVYGIGLFTITLVDLLLITVLAITIQVLVNQKFLGYFLSAVLTLVFLSGDALPFFRDARLLQYGFRPKYYYSDISGFGRMLEPVRWFQSYWFAIALLFLCISALFWVRGVDTHPKQRWRIARQRFTRPMQLVMALSAIAALGLGGWVYYNTQIINAGTSIAEGTPQLIAYEKAYGSLRDAQPKVTAIQIQGDLYPEEDSRFAVKGTYTLQNQTQKPIKTILVSVLPEIQINQITINDAFGEKVQHPVLQVYNIPLSSPLKPGATIEATFDLVRKPPVGFEANPKDFSNYLTNGASFRSTDFLPMIGFIDRLLVKDPQQREQAGLPKLDPAAELARASRYQVNHPDTDRALFSATLSTALDQSIFTSGKKVREWTEEDRHYAQFESLVPIAKMVPIVSGRYEVLRSDWKDVPIEIHYYKGHDRNLQRILRGVQKGLDYASQNFSPYPYQSLRIVETPYVSEALSYGGGQITMGERLAFLKKLDDNDPSVVDSAFRFAAHETAHQWWGGQLSVSQKLKGSRILAESLAEYTANQAYAKEFGQEKLGLALRSNLNVYLSNRSRSDVPLVEASDNHLVYEKGSLAMFALQDYLGEDVVNRALAKFLKERSDVPPYPSGKDLVAALRQVTPEKYQYLITDLFETVTLYNNKAESATVKQRPDGKYDVTLSLSTEKVRSDKNGNETPTNMNDEVDVGAFDATGKLIYLKKHPFKSGDTKLTIVVAQRPQTAGIDPLNKLIDKVPDDNLTAVKGAVS